MTVAEIVNKRGNTQENLLAILRDIQDASGDNSLHRETIDELAALMGIPVAAITSTASFYTMLSLKPRGRHIVRICESPPCWLMGSDNILDALKRKLGVGLGETTPDGMFSIESTSCIGVCGVAPAIMVDDAVYGNLTSQKLMDIIDRLSDDATPIIKSPGKTSIKSIPKTTRQAKQSNHKSSRAIRRKSGNSKT